MSKAVPRLHNPLRVPSRQGMFPNRLI